MSLKPKFIDTKNYKVFYFLTYSIYFYIFLICNFKVFHSFIFNILVPISFIPKIHFVIEVPIKFNVP